MNKIQTVHVEHKQINVSLHKKYMRLEQRETLKHTGNRGWLEEGTKQED